MKSALKTFITRLANSLTVPAAWLSGLATIAVLLCMLVSFESRTVNVLQFFLVALSIFYLTVRYLIGRLMRAKALVASVNLKEGLSLDDTQLLGYPSTLFIAFDPVSQKLAQCQSATGEHQIRDFSWVLGWRCEWRQVERMEMGGVARIVNATGLSVPAFERTRQLTDLALVLEVADASHPVLRFPMSRRAVQEWCTRCNSLFSC